MEESGMLVLGDWVGDKRAHSWDFVDSPSPMTSTIVERYCAWNEIVKVYNFSDSRRNTIVFERQHEWSREDETSIDGSFSNLICG